MTRMGIALMFLIVLGAISIAQDTQISRENLIRFKSLLKEVRLDIKNVCAQKEKLNIEINEENIIKGLKGYVQEEDIERIFKEINASPKDFKIKYFRRDYSGGNADKLPVAMRVIIHPNGALFYENNMGAITKRNIPQERKKFIKEKIGKHYGDVYLFGYVKSDYYIKYYGGHKVKYYDYFGKMGDGRLYQTYIGNYSVLIWCMNNYFDGESIGRYDDSNGGHYWGKWFVLYLCEIERMIATI